MTNRKLIWGAMFTAMIAVATLYLKIPGPTGYYHLGDGLIYAAAILLGPGIGAIAAALGSALADMMGGYVIWAGPTFFIKGLTALAIGYIAHRGLSATRNLGAMLVGALITMVGYSVTAYFLYGRLPAVALAEFYGNIGQTGSGIVIGMLLVSFLRRIRDFS